MWHSFISFYLEKKRKLFVLYTFKVWLNSKWSTTISRAHILSWLKSIMSVLFSHTPNQLFFLLWWKPERRRNSVDRLEKKKVSLFSSTRPHKNWDIQLPIWRKSCRPAFRSTADLMWAGVIAILRPLSHFSNCDPPTPPSYQYTNYTWWLYFPLKKENVQLWLRLTMMYINVYLCHFITWIVLQLLFLLLVSLPSLINR